MKIDTWFPTSILFDELSHDKYDLKALINQAYHIKNNYPNVSDWNCETYNSLHTYDLLNDGLFKPLIKDLCPMVATFVDYLGVDYKDINYKEGWINIAPPGEYQEYHTHPNSHISVVVYLQTLKDCGNIVFKSFSANSDMFALPIKNPNQSNYQTCWYEPSELKVLIFRSNILHMVMKNKSMKDRISAAFNFVIGNH